MGALRQLPHVVRHRPQFHGRASSSSSQTLRVQAQCSALEIRSLLRGMFASQWRHHRYIHQKCLASRHRVHRSVRRPTVKLARQHPPVLPQSIAIGAPVASIFSPTPRNPTVLLDSRLQHNRVGCSDSCLSLLLWGPPAGRARRCVQTTSRPPMAASAVHHARRTHPWCCHPPGPPQSRRPSQVLHPSRRAHRSPLQSRTMGSHRQQVLRRASLRGVGSSEPRPNCRRRRRLRPVAGAQLPHVRASLRGEHEADRQGAGSTGAPQLLLTRSCRSGARTFHPHRGSDVFGPCWGRLRGH